MKNIKSIIVSALFLMTAINTNAQGKSRLYYNFSCRF